MASWTWQDILQLWIAALAVSLALIATQIALFRRRNPKFFWLLPYPGTVAGFAALTREIAKRTPLIAVALYGVPALAIALTLVWMLVR